jgi:membrane-associated protein
MEGNLIQEIGKFLGHLGHGNLQDLIKSIGLLGIWGIIFAESGIMLGFFLPGDSLLVTSGLLASQGFFNIAVLLFGCFVCAVLGDNVGYFTGYRLGRKLFNKEDSRFFKKSYLQETENFYNKHGQKTIILARFVPVVRTFAPIVAGTAAMKYKTFMFFNLIGGFIWTMGLTLFGYFLGRVVPDVDRYLLPIILVIIVLSLAPAIWHLIEPKLKK